MHCHSHEIFGIHWADHHQLLPFFVCPVQGWMAFLGTRLTFCDQCRPRCLSTIPRSAKMLSIPSSHFRGMSFSIIMAASLLSHSSSMKSCSWYTSAGLSGYKHTPLTHSTSKICSSSLGRCWRLGHPHRPTCMASFQQMQILLLWATHRPPSLPASCRPHLSLLQQPHYLTH